LTGGDGLRAIIKLSEEHEDRGGRREGETRSCKYEEGKRISLANSG